MSQSKMKSFEKKMANGVHATYQGAKGTLYKFMVTFENGDVGEANSTKTEPSWKIGDEYTYEKSTNGNYTNIKGMKKVETGGGYSGGGGNSKANDPEYQRQQTFIWAIHNANEYIKMVTEREYNLMLSGELEEDKRTVFTKDVLNGLRSRLVTSAYEFDNVTEGRSFISATIALYPHRFMSLGKISEVIALAKEYYDEFKPKPASTDV